MMSDNPYQTPTGYPPAEEFSAAGPSISPELVEKNIASIAHGALGILAFGAGCGVMTLALPRQSLSWIILLGVLYISVLLFLSVGTMMATRRWPLLRWLLWAGLLPAGALIAVYLSAAFAPVAAIDTLSANAQDMVLVGWFPFTVFALASLLGWLLWGLRGISRRW
jgi:hypothetical protein